MQTPAMRVDYVAAVAATLLPNAIGTAARGPPDVRMSQKLASQMDWDVRTAIQHRAEMELCELTGLGRDGADTPTDLESWGGQRGRKGEMVHPVTTEGDCDSEGVDLEALLQSVTTDSEDLSADLEDLFGLGDFSGLGDLDFSSLSDDTENDGTENNGSEGEMQKDSCAGFEARSSSVQQQKPSKPLEGASDECGKRGGFKKVGQKHRGETAYLSENTSLAAESSTAAGATYEQGSVEEQDGEQKDYEEFPEARSCYTDTDMGIEGEGKTGDEEMTEEMDSNEDDYEEDNDEDDYEVGSDEDEYEEGSGENEYEEGSNDEDDGGVDHRETLGAEQGVASDWQNRRSRRQADRNEWLESNDVDEKVKEVDEDEMGWSWGDGSTTGEETGEGTEDGAVFVDMDEIEGEHVNSDVEFDEEEARRRSPHEGVASHTAEPHLSTPADSRVDLRGGDADKWISESESRSEDDPEYDTDGMSDAAILSEAKGPPSDDANGTLDDGENGERLGGEPAQMTHGESGPTEPLLREKGADTRSTGRPGPREFLPKAADEGSLTPNAQGKSRESHKGSPIAHGRWDKSGELSGENLDTSDARQAQVLDEWIESHRSNPLPSVAPARKTLDQLLEEGLDESEEDSDERARRLQQHQALGRRWVTGIMNASGFQRSRKQIMKILLLQATTNIVSGGGPPGMSPGRERLILAAVGMAGLTAFVHKILFLKIEKADYRDTADVTTQGRSPMGFLLGKKATVRRVSAREHDLACVRCTAKWGVILFVIGGVLSASLRAGEPLFIFAGLALWRFLAEPVFFVHALGRGGGARDVRRPFVSPSIVNALLGSPHGLA